MSAFDETDYVDVSGDKGILKKILAEGTGDYPNANDEVQAHYIGTLDDGTVFDSSRDRGRVFKFTIGKGQVYSYINAATVASDVVLQLEV